jgi:hypothetical protein
MAKQSALDVVVKPVLAYRMGRHGNQPVSEGILVSRAGSACFGGIITALLGWQAGLC